jgi:hypothetical protein
MRVIPSVGEVCYNLTLDISVWLRGEEGEDGDSLGCLSKLKLLHHL